MKAGHLRDGEALFKCRLNNGVIFGGGELSNVVAKRDRANFTLTQQYSLV